MRCFDTGAAFTIKWNPESAFVAEHKLDPILVADRHGYDLRADERTESVPRSRLWELKPQFALLNDRIRQRPQCGAVELELDVVHDERDGVQLCSDQAARVILVVLQDGVSVVGLDWASVRE